MANLSVREQTELLYRQVLQLKDPDRIAAMRKLGERDLYFLLTVVLRRTDLRHDWWFERCREVQAAPDGYLDLWYREAGKSSIITIGKTIQDILANPEITVGIFSHTRPLAKDLLRLIKREFEDNALLKDLWPDVLWRNPSKEAPTWSEDAGLVVQRRGNPRESTLEAWGLVEGAPTGKHFSLLVMDDIVVQENAGSPEMRAKTLKAWERALFLGKRGGARRMIGTRYHFGDAYADILKRQAAIPRLYPAERDGQPAGHLSRQELDQRRREAGPYTYAAQMLLDPTEDSAAGFKLGWIRTYHGEATGNVYVIVDPANSKRKKSDYTAAWALAAGADGNWYVRWCIRDRLNLQERINLVMWMHREFRPIRVGYEQYGIQADIQAIQAEQNRQSYRFDIVPLGGQVAKYDRIQRLAPMFEQGKIWFPESLWVDLKETGERVDIIEVFRRHEYEAFPYCSHDDMLDALARITDEDLGVVWPRSSETVRRRRPMLRVVDAESTRWVA